MFVVNSEIMVNFLLAASLTPGVITDYDIRVIQPNGDSDFYESAILPENFIAATGSTTGGIGYPFTPTTEGVWVIALSQGTAPNFDIYKEYFIRVSSPDTHVYQQVRGS